MFWHSWATFIIETLKIVYTTQLWLLTTPYRHCTNNPNSWRGSSTPAQSHSVIRASLPERKGDEDQGATLLWEGLGLPCGLSPWWTCASAQCLWGCKHNSEHTHKKKMPLSPPGCSTDDPPAAAYMTCVASTWRIPNRERSQTKCNQVRTNIL